MKHGHILEFQHCVLIFPLLISGGLIEAAVSNIDREVDYKFPLLISGGLIEANSSTANPAFLADISAAN